MKWFKHLVFLVFFVMFEFDTLNKVVTINEQISKSAQNL